MFRFVLLTGFFHGAFANGLDDETSMMQGLTRSMSALSNDPVFHDSELPPMPDDCCSSSGAPPELCADYDVQTMFLDGETDDYLQVGHSLQQIHRDLVHQEVYICVFQNYYCLSQECWENQVCCEHSSDPDNCPSDGFERHYSMTYTADFAQVGMTVDASISAGGISYCTISEDRCCGWPTLECKACENGVVPAVLEACCATGTHPDPACDGYRFDRSSSHNLVSDYTQLQPTTYKWSQTSCSTNCLTDGKDQFTCSQTSYACCQANTVECQACNLGVSPIFRLTTQPWVRIGNPGRCRPRDLLDSEVRIVENKDECATQCFQFGSSSNGRSRETRPECTHFDWKVKQNGQKECRFCKGGDLGDADDEVNVAFMSRGNREVFRLAVRLKLPNTD